MGKEVRRKRLPRLPFYFQLIFQKRYSPSKSQEWQAVFRKNQVLMKALCKAYNTFDGLIIEVHNDPEHALCDGAQSLRPETFAHLMGELKGIAQIVGRDL